MSKKSRKRNKKILGILAAGLGAAALMKRKKRASMASMDDAGIGVTHSALTDTAPPVIRKDVLPESKPKKKINTSVGDWKGYGHPLIQGNIQKKKAFEERMAAPGPRNALPPSMRGGAQHAEGYQAPGRNIRGRLQNARPTQSYNMYGLKKGGRVTGIAKRGFGRALMKGKK